MTIFSEFVPAAQEIETRGSHCFFTTMAGSNRWTKSTGSTAHASTQLIHVPEDDEPYHKEDSEPLGKAGKSHIIWIELLKHVPMKSTWNFGLPSDRSVSRSH